MFCPKCGKENKDGARFCSGCGSSLPGFENDGTYAGGPADKAEKYKTAEAEPSAEDISVEDPSASLPSGADPDQKSSSEKGSGKKKLIFIFAGAAAVIIAAIVVTVLFLNRDGAGGEYTELEFTGGYAESYDNGDTVYIPSTENLAYDETSYTIYYDDLLIVYLYSDISDEAADELAESVSGSVVGDISGAVNVIQIQIESTDLDSINEYAQTLMESENVMYAGYVYPMFTEEFYTDSNPWNDSGEESDRGNEENPDGNDWWAEAIGAYTAWEIADSCNLVSVSVGILDSGFYLEHEDLSDDISMLAGYSTNSGTDHGTHVAGIIGADNNDTGIRGIADSADLICADWSPINDSDDPDYVNIVTSGEYIEIFKQMLESGVKVINNSWGSNIMSEESFEYYVKNSDGLDDDGNEIYSVLEWMSIYIGTYDFTTDYNIYINETKIGIDQTAWESMLLIYQLELNGYEDFLIVQASGNGYDNSGPGTEAFWTGWFASVDEDLFNDFASTNGGIDTEEFSYEDFKNHVIIVGNATNEQDEDGNYLVNEGSSWGDTVDIIAPGTDIYSTLTTLDDTGSSENDGLIYGCLSGTSMAAPMVAGSAALLWQINPDLTAAEVKALLTENSNMAIGVTGDDAGVIYPMLNIGKAAQAAADSLEADETAVMYRLYYDKLMELQEEYGEISHSYSYWNDGEDSLEGLCFASLLDFDSNGYEELILAYSTGSYYEYDINYNVEIWEYSDGAIEKIFEGDTSWTNGAADYIVISGLNGIYYYIQQYESDYYAWGYDGDEFAVVKSIVMDWDTYEHVTEGSTVMDEEGADLSEEYYAEYWFEYRNLEETEAELEATLKTLRDYLGIESSSSQADSSQEETSQADASEETETTEPAADAAITFSKAYVYSEGLAWIEFTADTVDYYGVINKQGELVFAVEYGDGSGIYIGEVSDFGNGYSCVTYYKSGYNRDTYRSYSIYEYVIFNAEGEISAEYFMDNYDEICYGDGYFMTKEYSADYYSENYVYTIYSPKGETLWTYETTDGGSMSYDSDRGVFKCGEQEYTVEVYDYSEYPESSNPERTIEVSEGADGYNYLILYDSSGNQVSEPILSVFDSDYKDGQCVYHGSRLIMNVWRENAIPAPVIDIYIYDENGNYIYALSEKGYESATYYSDGAVAVANDTDFSVYLNMSCNYVYIAENEEPVYLDLDGNLLFESIDMSAFNE